MTGLVRKAAFLAMGGMVIAGVAMAGVPTVANSTQPGNLKVGGTVLGATDTKVSSTYSIRDGQNNPVPNATVKIDFSGCADIWLCATQDAGPVTGGTYVFNCAANTIEATTNGLGQVTFRVRGSSSNDLGNEAGHTTPCATVTVNTTIAFTSQKVGAYDEDGRSGVGALDLSSWGKDALSAIAYGRSDYVTPFGAPSALDLSDWGADALQGVTSCLGSATVAPNANYCP